MQDSKTKLIIIILIVLIVLIIVIGSVLYVFTDLLKSKEILFKKYISQNVQNISEVLDISKEEQTIDLLRKTDYTEKMQAKLTYLENQNDEQEIYNIKESGIIKNSEKNSYRNISASYGDLELISLDLLEQEKTYGFRLANLVQQFVSVENASVSYFVSSMGYSGQYFSEVMQEVDVTGLLDFSNEELEKLTNTYAQIIFSDIDKESYLAKRGVMITLNNNQSITTNSYTLILTKNELDKIYKKVLTQAINDEIILSKLDMIDNKFAEAGFVKQEGKGLKEIYISKLQEISDSIEYEGTDERKIQITVYEKDGNTVRTAIKTETKEFDIDVDDTKGKQVSLKTIKLTNEGTEQKVYSLGKEENESGLIRTYTYNDETQNLEIDINSIKQESGMNIDANLKYSNEKITELNLESSSTINFSVTEAIPIYFNETNNILLNNYEGDKILSILDNLKNRAIKSIESSQAEINTKLLNNIILYIDKKEQKRAEEIQNNIETQKQRFNNQFILYEGQDIKYEYIQKLIKTISNNMSDYQVISGNQIRVYIEDGKKNEEKATEIANAISDKYTYNVNIGYSDEGYVKTIDISVYEK